MDISEEVLAELGFFACHHSNETGFHETQIISRMYVMPVTFIFGIAANVCNIFVFSHRQMRSQLVNWFLLALSISDLCVLGSSFFVFSAPVIVELLQHEELVALSARLLVFFYPIAHTTHTLSVYLTILVSVHRYFGVCHPFMMRRLGSGIIVVVVIFLATFFSIVFNIPRWMELKTIKCFSELFERQSVMVLPTDFMLSASYTIFYRNAAFTLIMLFVPFVLLAFVNCKIIKVLNTSRTWRKKHFGTSRVHQYGASDSQRSSSLESSVKSSLLIVPQVTANTRSSNGTSSMLVAMVTGFLFFNFLAIFNNVLELLLHQFHLSETLYALLVEVSTILVNLNACVTIVIYLVFGTKFRQVFFKMLPAWACPERRKMKRACAQKRLMRSSQSTLCAATGNLCSAPVTEYTRIEPSMGQRTTSWGTRSASKSQLARSRSLNVVSYAAMAGVTFTRVVTSRL